MSAGARRAVITLWRAYVPRWAHDPLSGEGALRFGGRWNPRGIRALYAARELSTAWAEYNQGLAHHPATIVQLTLTGARLADMTNEAVLAKIGVGPAIHACDWRADQAAGRLPATHALARKLAGQSFDGVIYPSVMSPGGSCVALWRWNGPGEPSLKAVDPEKRLPKDQKSWPGDA